MATIAPTDQPIADNGELRAVATGAMLQELQATRQEFSDNGWRQVGAPTIPWVKVGRLDASGTKLTLEACIDSSQVKVIDEAGNDVRSSDSSKRSRNLFMLVRSGPSDAWKVASRGFPAQADC